MTPRTKSSPTTRAHRGFVCERAAPTFREAAADVRPDFQLFTHVRFLRESAAYLGLCAAEVGRTIGEPRDSLDVHGNTAH